MCILLRLYLAPTAADAEILLKGFEAAYAGRSMVNLPKELVSTLMEVGGDSLTLRLRRRDPRAINEALKLASNGTAQVKDRIECIRILGEVGANSSVPVLLSIAKSGDLQKLQIAALTALHAFPDESIGVQLIRNWPDFDPALRDAALAVLSSRLSWSKELLRGVESEMIARDVVKPAIVERLLLQNDKRLAARVRAIWGSNKTTSSEVMRAEVHRLEQVLAEGAGNRYRGKQLYAKTCGKCHQEESNCPGKAISRDCTGWLVGGAAYRPACRVMYRTE